MNFWSHPQVKKGWETKQWDEFFLFHGFACASVAQSGGRGLKNPLAWPLFFKYFRQFNEKRRPGTFAILAPRLYNSYNQAHVADRHMWQSPGPGPGSKCSKTEEVGCLYSELKPCQCEIATDEIQGEKNYRERINIKSARISALTGSAQRKMAAARQKVSATCENRTHSSDYKRPALTTQHMLVSTCRIVDLR